MRPLALLLIALALPSVAGAQTANQLTQQQLVDLTARGVALGIGGPGWGFSGQLTLFPDGRGVGQATTDGGDVIALDGTWTIRDGMLCRTWGRSNDGAEVCEIWVLTSGRSVDVYLPDGQKIGANTW